MFRPTGFADLAGKRVGIFGYGVEGRATERRLRGTCELFIVDDLGDPAANVLATNDGGFEILLTCDVVLKSPGISRYRDDVRALEENDVVVTSALNLWLHDVDRHRVVGVTGTKGKSTTTSLIVFMLHCLSEKALALGNIGAPPYDPDVDTSDAWLIIEMSSFQCVDITVAPATVVVTSLGSDHLDWHGSIENYRRDKLSLTRADGAHRTFVAESASTHAEVDQIGGDVSFVRADTTGLAPSLDLLGVHNDVNVALALEVVERLTSRSPSEILDLIAINASSFQPLRGRLTLSATEELNGNVIQYVDDGLATSALPTISALSVFESDDVALIAGGFDRGVDYSELAVALGERTRATHVIAMGAAGQRIVEAIAASNTELDVAIADNLADAVSKARASLTSGGVVLFSPAAPSFDHYRNWEERSNDFVELVSTLIRSS